MKNCIVITFDQLLPFHNLPDSFSEKLRGYQAFKKRSVEFTNAYCNRQGSSSSRSVMLSGLINTGIQDDISLTFQQVPRLSYDVNTPGKTFIENKIDKTAFYGAQNINKKLSMLENNEVINFSAASVGTMKDYGYNQYNVLGDPSSNLGIIGDQMSFDGNVSSLSSSFDIQDCCTGVKRQGLMPFLEARLEDNKPYFIQLNLLNPSDTNKFWQSNFNGHPKSKMAPFLFPFAQEQMLQNIFNYSPLYQDAYVDHINLTHNFFEDNYLDYALSLDSMPFKQSYEQGYITESEVNATFPFLYSMYNTLGFFSSIADNSSDIKSWKNLINNYYGLIFEVDNYLMKLHRFLECNDLWDSVSIIITSTNGDMMSSHGLKGDGFHFENSVKVPLLIASTDIPQSLWNTKSSVLCSHLDLNPTIEHLSKLSNVKTYNGTSLFQPNFNVRANNPIVLNFNLSFQNLVTSYVLWIQSFNNMSIIEQSRVYRNPTNIFEYYFSFIETVSVIDGVKWKWVRYFSLRDYIFENIIGNVSKSEVILANIDNMRFQGSVKQQVLDLLPSAFNFQQQFEIMKTIGTAYPFLASNDKPYLYVYMTMMFNYLNVKKNYRLDVPGNNNTYEVNIVRYPYFCYNLTEDPNEIVNLADPYRQALPVFSSLDLDMIRRTDALSNETLLHLPNNLFETLLRGVTSNLIEYNLGNMTLDVVRDEFSLVYGLLKPVLT